jgi:HD-GYP domain-containing protein (c-di-GMP phosphodiesterase class II)
MSVHVVADADAKLPVLRAMIEQRHAITSELLSSASIPRGKIDSVVVAADVANVENIAALKAISDKLARIPKRVFLIDGRGRLSVVQAYALGATHVLSNPVNQKQLLAKLADIESPPIAPIRIESSGSQEAASAGSASIAAMFAAVLDGTAVDVAGTRGAGSRIAESITENGLSAWLSTVRRHHEGTFQHCLLVTGIAVDFGLSLGLSKPDIERLSSAAMFHDIGKATIPLAVLDKPARLDDGERALIETHPAAGYDVLKGTPGISAEILDCVRHHHEYLDGSGYPDKLTGESICDLVRVLTISDIFAALVEYRTYKPTMPRETAYEILLGMNGKLEKPLLHAFRDVALNR